ncbi:esterase/lipase family protein [Corynebacterium cystitidis]|uniref:Alpha/beta hydrolase family protein n=1 Tax=Corynebacterium cystitidis DSM 20524 TaxID=1121357 RepID=A0A1H9WQ36_9CORY|nr:alpha/beta fold hydrolase [Corynebacterium cystitidis]WJY81655.1 Extracellular esterase EstB precursor [Corynebacterium cystitidis DSM 20524]SES35975.1 Alpha/beta hydrolase family protein [Corynebacterium cystitidis DSM 20524]SNV85267.1 triacylglycerol lipase precursor [Corynebacterium cystitidis]
MKNSENVTRRIISTVIAVATVVVAGVGTMPQASADPLSTSSLDTSQVQGAAFNDPDCKSEFNPVIFIHGTSTTNKDWKNASNYLAERGYCTWAINYGAEPGRISYGWADLDQSAAEIAAGINNILARTGAEKVSLIGHSQGGMMIKRFIEEPGANNDAKVDRVVTFGASFGGTDVNGMRWLRGLFNSWPEFWKLMAGAAAFQQVVGDAGESSQIARVKSLPDTSPGIIYTAVYSPRDTTVTDTTSTHPVYGKNLPSTLQGEPGWVVNVDADQECGYSALLAHAQFPYSAEPIQLMEWGITRTPEMTTPVCGTQSSDSSPTVSSSL